MPFPPGASVEEGTLAPPFPSATVEVEGAVTCLCCQHEDCALPFSECCLTITCTDTPVQFYEFNFITKVHVATNPVTPSLVLPDYSPQTITGSGGTPLMLFLSGTKTADNGASICYRFALPIFFQCVGALDEEGHTVILGWRLCALKPADVVTVFAVDTGAPGYRYGITCAYSTMEQFYGWGYYNPGGSGLELDSTPPCDNPSGCYGYSYDAFMLYQSNNGVLSTNLDVFLGCDRQCSGHMYAGGPLPGRLPQNVVVGAPLLPAASMDLEVVIPGEWFTIPFCGGEITFDDFTLAVHIDGDLTDCEEGDVAEYSHTGACWVAANTSQDWCVCAGTTTTTTTSTTTTSTSSTSSTSTSSTTSTSTTTSTTTTPEGGPTPLGDDTCCPEGVNPGEVNPVVSVAVDAPTPFECFDAVTTAVWNAGLKAWTFGYFPCGTEANVYIYCREGSLIFRFVGCGVDVEATRYAVREDASPCNPGVCSEETGTCIVAFFSLPPGNTCFPDGATFEVYLFHSGGGS